MPNAAVLTTYGPPNVLQWTDVPMPEPSERQVRIRVRVSGVGPTDLKIRRGDLNGVFPLPEHAVLGFEAAGVVDAIGGQVSGVAVGDEVAALLPSLGGYGEYALAAAWTRKPPQVSWDDAGALPASVEAAVGVLRQLGVGREHRVLLVLDDTTAFPVMFLAAMRIGAVPVPVSPLDKDENFRHYVEDSYATVVATDSGSVEPMPSMMSSPKRSRQRSNVCGGSASAADTQRRTESRAPSADGSRTSAP